MNCNNLGNVKSPVKRKRQRHTAVKAHMKKHRANLDDVTKRQIGKTSVKKSRTKLDDVTRRETSKSGVKKYRAKLEDVTRR